MAVENEVRPNNEPSPDVVTVEVVTPVVNSDPPDFPKPSMPRNPQSARLGFIESSRFSSSSDISGFMEDSGSTLI